MKRTEPRNPEQTRHLREHLNALMGERRLPPGELAAKAIIPLSSLLRILDGTIKNPGLDVTLSLAKALSVTISELAGDTVMNKDHTTLYIEARDRTGLLHDITEVINAHGHGLNIASSISTAIGPVARCVIHIEGPSTTIQKFAEQLKAVPWVRSVWTRHQEDTVSKRTHIKVTQ
jgi:glycine cleavage system regulatory protein